MQDRPFVLILGAQGFIGTALRKHLAAQGRWSLLSVDVQPPKAISALTGAEAAGCEEYLFQTDLGDPTQIQELFDQIGPERLSQVHSVVHLAAYYDFLNKHDSRYERLQTSMPALLGTIEERVPDAAPLIYASSMAAMAPTEPGHKLTAASPRLGAWAYPQHKIASEKLLEGSGLTNPIVELVLSGVYSDLCELVPLFQQIERVRERSIEAIFYPGKVDRGLTYVHIDDCVDAFVRAIETYQETPGIHRLLVGEPEPVTYQTIHQMACRVFLDTTLPLLPMPKALAKFGSLLLGGVVGLMGRRRFIRPWMVSFAGEHFEFDISETTRALGWVPTHRLHQKLPRILGIAKHHPNLWLTTNELRPW